MYAIWYKVLVPITLVYEYKGFGGNPNKNGLAL